jgi:tetratricopeptide (TPR) repeat protein
MLLAGMACGAAPPAMLTAKQEASRRQRNAHWAEGLRAWEAGKQAEAIAALEESLAVHLLVWGPLDRTTDIIAQRLADCHKARSEWEKEAKYGRMVLEARRALLGEGHYQTVNARLELAEALAQQKRTLAQRAALARALGLYGQATSLYRKGQAARAAPLLKQALEIYKEVLGEKHPHYARGLNNLAYLFEEMGEYKAALPLHKQALRIIRDALGEKHPEYATGLHNLAFLYQKMGDHKQALHLEKQALAIYKEALGEKHPLYATGLNSLAMLYQDMGDHKQALPLFKQALSIRKEALGEKHPLYASSLTNLAGLYYSLGDHKQALPLIKQALKIRKQVLGEKHPEYANSLHNLALLYQSMGALKQALPLFKWALRIIREALGEKHPDYAHSLNNLAHLYQKMGDYKQALPLAEEAVALTLAHLRNSGSVQSDRQQLAAADLVRYRLDVCLSLGDVGSYKHVLAFKGAVLLRQRQRRLFSALSAGPDTRQIARDLQSVTRQIAALSASSRPVREQLERLTGEQERLQSKLSLLSTEADAAFTAQTLTPKALSQALPEGAVLVDFLFYTRHGVVYRDGRSNRLRCLVAFVNRKGKPTARIDLGPADRAAEAINRWRLSLLDGKAGTALGAEVKNLIWSPLEEHLKGAKVVLVSPDGPLSSVPFCALPGQKPGTYLIEDVALAVVPVPQMLPEMLKPVDKAKRLKPSLLVVGDVDYDRAGAVARADKIGDRGAPLGIRRDWGKLPGTSVEVAAVSRSFTKLFKKEGTVTDLDGADATKAKVRQALQKVRYAHLATHGFFAQ